MKERLIEGNLENLFEPLYPQIVASHRREEERRRYEGITQKLISKGSGSALYQEISRRVRFITNHRHR